MLGAAGGIGQPLAMLCKLSPMIDEVACYDVVGAPGVAADLSHAPTNAKVTGHLPSTGTWFLDGPLEESVSLAHPRNALTGEPKRDHCVVQIKIKRNWLIFFVKQICTMLLVTAGGLMALLMQPGELLGDRCAQILVSVLIIITTPWHN